MNTGFVAINKFYHTLRNQFKNTDNLKLKVSKYLEEEDEPSEELPCATPIQPVPLTPFVPTEESKPIEVKPKIATPDKLKPESEIKKMQKIAALPAKKEKDEILHSVSQREYDFL